MITIIQLPKNIVESSITEFQHCFDLRPVPIDFDYSFLMINHFWDYIIISAKCYGEDFASSYMGHQRFGLAERRFYALALSFIIGAGTHQLYLKWQQPILPVPPYYSPAMIAFVVEFICPKVGRNRRKFLFYSIGSATVLCIAYDRNDYAIAYDHVALPINSMYNQLICTILYGTYMPERAPHEAIPDTFEEQYTMITH
ncbi:hypothetical protein DINM_022424 [Dirofilaria immitis]|nr:hypothetical protein [Dirofilaria immitis]